MATFTNPCIYITDVSTACTFSVLFKCNIDPYCAMINIWAYNYYGIESYKSIWVLYTNIIALLLYEKQTYMKTITAQEYRQYEVIHEY